MTEQQTPTQIDPADIRPGDVVDVIRRVEVDAIDDGYILTKRGACLSMDNSARTWHLVHRPDPDAEVIEALDRGGINGREHLAWLRRLGFDVVKRAES